MCLVTNLINSLNSLLVELNLLEVLTNARGSDGLGDDGVAANLSPGQQDVSGGDGLALGGREALSGGLDVGVSDEQRRADGVVAEGRVRCDDDALLGAVLDQLGRLEARVALDLVRGGDDASGIDGSLEL